MGYWTRPFDNHVQRVCDSPSLIESVWPAWPADVRHQVGGGVVGQLPHYNGEPGDGTGSRRYDAVSSSM